MSPAENPHGSGCICFVGCSCHYRMSMFTGCIFARLCHIWSPLYKEPRILGRYSLWNHWLPAIVVTGCPGLSLFSLGRNSAVVPYSAMEPLPSQPRPITMLSSTRHAPFATHPNPNWCDGKGVLDVLHIYYRGEGWGVQGPPRHPTAFVSVHLQIHVDVQSSRCALARCAVPRLRFLCQGLVAPS